MMKKKKFKTVLFIKSSCPFCEQVLTYLQQMNKIVTIKDLKHHKDAAHELHKLTGKQEVPCLLVDDAPIFESKAIMLWLEEHKKFLDDVEAGKRL